MGTAASGYIDPTKVGAAQTAQGAGADGRTVLQGQYLASVLNPLSGITTTPGAAGTYQAAMGESGQSVDTPYYTPTTYSDAAGQSLYGLLGQGGDKQYTSQADYNAQLAQKEAQLGLNPNQTYLTSSFDNPTGNGSKDQAQGLYTLGADGTATPVGGLNSYSPGNFVDVGRNELEGLGTVLSAGALGGAFGAGTGVAGGTAQTGNMALIDSGLGTAGYGASSAGDLTGLGTAGAGSSAAGATSQYMGPGSAGAGATGEGAAATGGGGSLLSNALKGIGQGLAKQTGGAGSGNVAQLFAGGLSAGDRYRQQLLGQALQNQASQPAAQQAMPGWIPATQG